MTRSIGTSNGVAPSRLSGSKSKSPTRTTTLENRNRLQREKKMKISRTRSSFSVTKRCRKACSGELVCRLGRARLLKSSIMYNARKAIHTYGLSPLGKFVVQWAAVIAYRFVISVPPQFQLSGESFRLVLRYPMATIQGQAPENKPKRKTTASS